MSVEKRLVHVVVDRPRGECEIIVFREGSFELFSFLQDLEYEDRGFRIAKISSYDRMEDDPSVGAPKLNKVIVPKRKYTRRAKDSVKKTKKAKKKLKD